MELKQRIEENIKKALKERDKERLSILRLLASEIKNKEIEKRGELQEEELVQVISKQVKKGKEAAEEFEKGKALNRAAQERAEVAILEEYLPSPLSSVELRKLVEEAIAKIGATSLKDLGQVMKIVMPQVKGRAEGAQVNALVREVLTSKS